MSRLRSGWPDGPAGPREPGSAARLSRRPRPRVRNPGCPPGGRCASQRRGPGDAGALRRNPAGRNKRLGSKTLIGEIGSRFLTAESGRCSGQCSVADSATQLPTVMPILDRFSTAAGGSRPEAGRLVPIRRTWRSTRRRCSARRAAGEFMQSPRSESPFKFGHWSKSLIRVRVSDPSLRSKSLIKVAHPSL